MRSPPTMCRERSPSGWKRSAPTARINLWWGFGGQPDWARRYWLQQPLMLPAGTRLDVHETFTDPGLMAAAFGAPTATGTLAPPRPIRLSVDVVEQHRSAPIRGGAARSALLHGQTNHDGDEPGEPQDKRVRQAVVRLWKQAEDDVTDGEHPRTRHPGRRRANPLTRANTWQRTR